MVLTIALLAVACGQPVQAPAEVRVVLAECESTTVNKSPLAESTFSVGKGWKPFRVAYYIEGRPIRGVSVDALTFRPFEPGERVYWIAHVTKDGDVVPVTGPMAARRYLPNLSLMSRSINEREVRGSLNRDIPPEVRTAQMLAHLVSRASTAPQADNRAAIIREYSQHPDPAIREYVRWLTRRDGE